MAPELLNHQDYDEKVDVYAFAMMMYLLLANSRIVIYKIPEEKVVPLDRDRGIREQKRLIADGKRPVDRQEIPECYMSLIKRCWSQEPSDRPSFAEIVEIMRADEFSHSLGGNNDAAIARRRDYIDRLDRAGE